MNHFRRLNSYTRPSRLTGTLAHWNLFNDNAWETTKHRLPTPYERSSWLGLNCLTTLKTIKLPSVALYLHSGKSIHDNSFPIHDGMFYLNCGSQFVFNIAFHHIKPWSWSTMPACLMTLEVNSLHSGLMDHSDIFYWPTLLHRTKPVFS